MSRNTVSSRTTHACLRLPRTRAELADLLWRFEAQADPLLVGTEGSRVALGADIESFLDGEARRQPAAECGTQTVHEFRDGPGRGHQEVWACQRRTRHPWKSVV